MSNLANLLERVKAATGPDRELSAAIWLGVGAKRKGNLWQLPGEWTASWASPPDVTSSIDAALALVEAKLPGWGWHGGGGLGNNDAWATFRREGGEAHGEAPTLPLAILTALLAALLQQEGASP